MATRTAGPIQVTLRYAKAALIQAARRTVVMRASA